MCSVSNKHNEFVQWQCSDSLGISEVWWIGSHDWSIGMGVIQALEEGQDSGWEDGKARVGQPLNNVL